MTQLTLYIDGMGGMGDMGDMCDMCDMGDRDGVRELTSRLRDVPGVATVAADHRRCVVVLVGSMSRSGVLAALEGTRFVIDRIGADSDETGTGQQSP